MQWIQQSLPFSRMAAAVPCLQHPSRTVYSSCLVGAVINHLTLWYNCTLSWLLDGVFLNDTGDGTGTSQKDTVTIIVSALRLSHPSSLVFRVSMLSGMLLWENVSVVLGHKHVHWAYALLYGSLTVLWRYSYPDTAHYESDGNHQVWRWCHLVLTKPPQI